MIDSITIVVVGGIVYIAVCLLSFGQWVMDKLEDRNDS